MSLCVVCFRRGALCSLFFFFFFFNDTATTEIYTLSLHDALPISLRRGGRPGRGTARGRASEAAASGACPRSEEHTSELQSPCNLVCRLLLEKKKNTSRQKLLIAYHVTMSRHMLCCATRRVCACYL